MCPFVRLDRSWMRAVDRHKRSGVYGLEVYGVSTTVSRRRECLLYVHAYSITIWRVNFERYGVLKIQRSTKTFKTLFQPFNYVVVVENNVFNEHSLTAETVHVMSNECCWKQKKNVVVETKSYNIYVYYLGRQRSVVDLLRYVNTPSGVRYG